MKRIPSDQKNAVDYYVIFDLIEENKLEQAYSMAKRLLDKNFGTGVIYENTRRFYNNFLWLCFELKKYEEGAYWSHKFQDVARKNPYIYHHAACFYVKVGQLTKALEQVELACKYRYEEIENMLNDQDLEPLFKMEKFQAIRKKTILNKELLKKVIFEAFEDVPKGDGLGARECVAEDDWGSKEEITKARSLDVEQYWWEYPKSFVESGGLKYSLTYNNKDGIKFHLPALMTADSNNPFDGGDISVFFKLCLESFKRAPHRGHKEYVGFLKSIDVSKIIEYYDFTKAQIHAIALYFLFNDDSYKKTRAESIASIKHSHEQSKKYGGGKKNYNLTLKDVIAIEDEEVRIVNDWIKSGAVVRDDFIVLDNNVFQANFFNLENKQKIS